MFNNFFKSVANFYHKFTIRKYINRAQALANDMNCRIYAIKFKGKVKFMTRENLKDFRSRGILPKNFTAIELAKNSLFIVDPKPHRK